MIFHHRDTESTETPSRVKLKKGCSHNGKQSEWTIHD